MRIKHFINIALAVALTFGLAACDKNNNKPEPEPEPDPDAYEAFKADNTLRFEFSNGDGIVNSNSAYHFFRDAGAFLSDRNKIGFSDGEATAYYLLEWEGDGDEGLKGSASLTTHEGTVPLHSLEIIKAEGGIIWLVYKTTESGAEEYAVQEW